MRPDARSAGELGPGRFAVVLGSAARLGVTGTLLVEHRGAKKMVHLRQGRPLRARSNILDECLGRLLVAEGAISEHQQAAALARKRTCDDPIGEILVDQGALPTAGLARALARQLEVRLLDLVGWRSGRWLFVPRDESGPAVDPELAVDRILFEGLANRLEESELVGWARHVAEGHIDHLDDDAARRARALDPDIGAALLRAVGGPVRAFLAGPDRVRRLALFLALGWTGELRLRAEPPPEGELGADALAEVAGALASLDEVEESQPPDPSRPKVDAPPRAATWSSVEIRSSSQSSILGATGPVDDHPNRAGPATASTTTTAEIGSSEGALAARVTAWRTADAVTRLGLDPSRSLAPSTVEAAHEAALQRLAAEAGPLEAVSGAARRHIEALGVLLDDARVELTRPEAARRHRNEAPGTWVGFAVLERAEAAVAALREGRREEHDAHWAAAAALDLELAAGLRDDPELCRARARAAAWSAAEPDAPLAWGRVLEVDPDDPIALARAPATSAPSRLWGRKR